jgi:nucleoid-associated protein EbfC
MELKDNLNTLLKEAQAMQEKLQSAQNELADMEVSGEAGGGLVVVIMNGRYNVKQVSINDSLFEDEDKEMLEDLVAAAINDAVRKIETSTREKVGKIASSVQLPEDFKLPEDE